jgi:hypothetical protein
MFCLKEEADLQMESMRLDISIRMKRTKNVGIVNGKKIYGKP